MTDRHYRRKHGKGRSDFVSNPDSEGGSCARYFCCRR
jgi:hypothetical protein